MWRDITEKEANIKEKMISKGDMFSGGYYYESQGP
jgi:hypothetical protein